MEHLFETYLTQRKLSPNTIKSYNYSRELFFSLYPRLTQRNLEQYKLYLLETYRPQTVNRGSGASTATWNSAGKTTGSCLLSRNSRNRSSKT